VRWSGVEVEIPGRGVLRADLDDDSPARPERGNRDFAAYLREVFGAPVLGSGSGDESGNTPELGHWRGGGAYTVLDEFPLPARRPVELGPPRILLTEDEAGD